MDQTKMRFGRKFISPKTKSKLTRMDCLAADDGSSDAASGYVVAKADDSHDSVSFQRFRRR